MKVTNINRLAICLCVLSFAFASTAGANWTYTYEDDFSTDKATVDSYDHSIFWPETALPPAEPYLFYTSTVDPPGALGFKAFDQGYAKLAYCFPIQPGGPQEIWGTIKFDVYDLNPGGGGGYMAVSLGDGVNWVLPMPLEFGHHEFSLGSHQGTSYFQLLGFNAAIDNLHVTLVPEPATLALLALGGLAAMKRRR